MLLLRRPDLRQESGPEIGFRRHSPALCMPTIHPYHLPVTPACHINVVFHSPTDTFSEYNPGSDYISPQRNYENNLVIFIRTLPDLLPFVEQHH